MAEYCGLIAGLKCALSLLQSPTNVKIIGDSKLVIKQVNGQYQVKSENLRTYYNQTLELITQLKGLGHQVTLTHVKRAFNSKADHLSNQALSKTQ